MSSQYNTKEWDQPLPRDSPHNFQPPLPGNAHIVSWVPTFNAARLILSVGSLRTLDKSFLSRSHVFQINGMIYLGNNVARIPDVEPSHNQHHQSAIESVSWPLRLHEIPFLAQDEFNYTVNISHQYDDWRGIQHVQTRPPRNTRRVSHLSYMRAKTGMKDQTTNHEPDEKQNLDDQTTDHNPRTYSLRTCFNKKTWSAWLNVQAQQIAKDKNCRGPSWCNKRKILSFDGSDDARVHHV